VTALAHDFAGLVGSFHRTSPLMAVGALASARYSLPGAPPRRRETLQWGQNRLDAPPLGAAPRDAYRRKAQRKSMTRPGLFDGRAGVFSLSRLLPARGDSEERETGVVYNLFRRRSRSDNCIAIAPCPHSCPVHYYNQIVSRHSSRPDGMSRFRPFLAGRGADRRPNLRQGRHRIRTSTD
jgi:hypothetical protein